MVIEVKQDGKFVKIPFISTNYPVGEAPEDGKQYARKDGDWSEVVIPDVDLTEIETNIAANTAAIDTKVDKVDGKQLSTEDYTTEDKTKVANIPTPDSIVVTTDPRLTVATTTKDGLMSAADKVQLDSTLTATEIENKVNAAVSSVYRVKGTVASVANLPTTGVVVGDVWNIADNGANYVATNNNPVEWDKLSETVDLSPYMQTSTANSTFVKKTGDTMTGDLIIKSSKAATVDGTDRITVRNVSEPSRCIAHTANEIQITPSKTSSVKGGFAYMLQDGSDFLGYVGAVCQGDDASKFYTFMGWGGNAHIPSNNLSVGQNVFAYKNISVMLADGTNSMTVRVPNDTNRRFIYAGNGIQIIPDDGTNATGILWRNQNNTANLAGIGVLTNGDSTTTNAVYSYMGWTGDGREPYAHENNLTVGRDKFTYKNNAVWHAGNDGAGSGLDADTVDGIQSERIIYGTSAYGSTNITPDNSITAKANNITKSGFYRCNQDSNFVPMVIHCNHATGSSHAFQLGTGYPAKDSLYFRIKTDGVWENTRKIVDTSTVLTQDEYNALGSNVNSDGKIYFIKE